MALLSSTALHGLQLGTDQSGGARSCDIGESLSEKNRGSLGGPKGARGESDGAIPRRAPTGTNCLRLALSWRCCPGGGIAWLWTEYPRGQRAPRRRVRGAVSRALTGRVRRPAFAGFARALLPSVCRRRSREGALRIFALPDGLAALCSLRSAGRAWRPARGPRATLTDALRFGKQSLCAWGENRVAFVPESWRCKLNTFQRTNGGLLSMVA